MELTVQQVAQNGEMANVERLRKFAMAAIYVCLVFMVCYLQNMCILWTITITSKPVNSVIQRYTVTLEMNWQFISESFDLLLADEKHSAHTDEHLTKRMFKKQLKEVSGN